VVGLKLVTPEVCAGCPFPDHHFPGDPVYPPEGVTPEMSAEELADRLEGPPGPWPPGWEDWEVTHRAHQIAADRFLARLPPYPGTSPGGRGVVLAGGGNRYFPSLYVTIRALRHVGCSLPVQVWYLGREGEMPGGHRRLLARWGVECVDATAGHPGRLYRILNGWQLKVFALAHCPFEEALLLDADCYPVRDPSLLFEDPGYRGAGAVFWPDLPTGAAVDWRPFGVPPSPRVTIDSAAVLVNKRLCWRPLQLAWWYNDHSDWSYAHGYGDKHTFEVAWQRCQVPSVMYTEVADWAVHSFRHVGPDGRPLFVHRCRDKFRFGPAPFVTDQNFEANHYLPSLPLEAECFAWLADLAGELGLRPAPPAACAAPPRVRVYLMTCAARRAVCADTLVRWRATDWGEEPVVVRDEDPGPGSSARMIANAHRMLVRAAEQEADFYLFLEDDLLFNLHLRHNLFRWPPVRDRWLWAGTLYNPSLPLHPSTGARLPAHCLALSPDGYFGSQGVVLSRPALRTVLREWDPHRHQDLNFAASAGRHAEAVLAHTPSLVQHLPVPSAWGGISHRAVDYDPFFRATDGAVAAGEAVLAPAAPGGV
jgi:hypothetical protein